MLAVYVFALDEIKKVRANIGIHMERVGLGSIVGEYKIVNDVEILV